ncbi:hypothetical protein PVAP13_2NG266603 [Panicum virgatum]|uniref:Uncharacterized protein n=1 Tax=Panicum virgatum TaxID=38727 RepID=A0A8T0VI95_PANVG|nr:hypothetical protein PVAP13_2NG266603 [Panicum virgatum]
MSTPTTKFPSVLDHGGRMPVNNTGMTHANRSAPLKSQDPSPIILLQYLSSTMATHSMQKLQSYISIFPRKLITFVEGRLTALCFLLVFSALHIGQLCKKQNIQ